MTAGPAAALRHAPPAPLALRPLWEALCVACRGGPVGFSGLLLLQALNVGMLWLFLPTQMQGLAHFPAELVLGHSWGAALFGWAAGALMAAQWRRQAQVVHGLRLPAAGRQMARALGWGLAIGCLLAALPPLVGTLLNIHRDAIVTLRRAGEVLDIPVPMWALLLHAVAAPTAGLLVGAATVLLGASRWRLLYRPLAVLLIANPWLQRHWAVPHALVLPGVVVTGLLAAAAAWTLARRLRRMACLAQEATPWMLPPAPAKTPHWLGSTTTAALPKGLPALVLPASGGWTAHLFFGCLQSVLVGLFVWWTGLRWGGGLLCITVLMPNLVAPWIGGVWVSPRLPGLPGAPGRAGMQRFVLVHTWRGGLPRLAVTTLPLLALGALMGAPMADLAATSVLVLAAAFWVAACAIATPAWQLQSTVFGWVPWAALTAVAAGLGWLLLRHPVGTPSLVAPALLASAGACAGGAAVLLASRRAWARLDWSRMPALPWPNRGPGMPAARGL